MKSTNAELAGMSITARAGALLDAATDDPAVGPRWNTEGVSALLRWVLFELEDRGLLQWPDVGETT
jgi:hypothetical protein